MKKLAFRGDSAVRIRVALVGPPNVGKSSLFNALTGRGPNAGAAAIVSDVPGTTRDYLTAELDLDGVKCELIDTAGIDETVGPSCREGLIHSPIEEDIDAGKDIQVGSPFRQKGPTVAAAAQQMTQEQFRTAHVRVVCAESDGAQAEVRGEKAGHPRSGSGRVRKNGAAEKIVVLTKCDLYSTPNSRWPDALQTSAATGEGIRELKAAIRAAVLRTAPQGEVVAGTAARCGESLRWAAASSDCALATVSAGLGEELIATEVRVALKRTRQGCRGCLYRRFVRPHLQPILHREVVLWFVLRIALLRG